MKKHQIIFAIILLLSILSFLSPIFFPDIFNWAIVIVAICLLTIAAFVLQFEHSPSSSKEIALIAMLSALSALSRVSFAFIPSVKPSSFIIISSGLVFGPIAGFIIGLSTPIVSNFFLGQGPWTLFQAIAWGLMGASAALIGKFSKKKLIIFGFIWGMAYGWILNLWFWAGFVFPLNLTTFIIANLNSLPFDILHAITNALLFAFFGEKVNVVLERFKQRFNVQRI
ncbi:MAG: ECF transporter S component [archaeon]|nr:ECF transporter S component [archaeon]